MKPNLKESLIKILSSPNHSSKEWIYSQFDSSVMCDTIHSSEESDAAIVRIHNTGKAIGITCDCNPIFCKSDPKLGAEISVAESWRNLIASGANPIAITDNLNFGNPEKKEVMHEIKEAIKGIKNACTKLDYPVVSGNVSLYNETNKSSILPTPVIGGVGLIEKTSYIKSLKMKKGAKIFVIGKTSGHLELSVFHQINGLTYGNPPKINFKDELKNGNFLKKIIRQTKIIIGCHDVSEGGISLAISELCIRNKMGVEIIIPKKYKSPVKWLFSEDQSRYIIIVDNEKELKKLAKKDKISIEKIGEVKGKSLNFKNLFQTSVDELIEKNSNWFNNYLRK